MKPSAIDIAGLTKGFSRRVAVDDLSMTVPTGAITGFVGPNGAGKTTTMRTLLGLVAPNAGTGTVLGQPLGEPGRYLHRVGARRSMHRRLRDSCLDIDVPPRGTAAVETIRTTTRNRGEAHG